MLSQLERHFYRLAEKSSLSVDRELSTQVVTALSPLLAKISPDPLELSVDIENFVINHERKLKHIFDSYADDDSAESLFLHQPESILVFYLLDRDEFSLAELWSRDFDFSFLDKLAIAWGVSLDYFS